VCWPDGTVRWLAARGSVTRDASGHALRILGFNWDITEQKRGENMRREKAAAEESSRSKSEFLSRMSHELRTPLNAVLGFAQIMLDDTVSVLDERNRERTQHVRDAGKHLLALIDDVLDLSSVEVSGMATEPVPLAPLVAEMAQWIAPAASDAGVELRVLPVDGTALADARRLRQVLTNLLSNAVKYNRPGGHVEVGVIEHDDAVAGRFIGIRVRDTGRGLSSEQMQRLFEPFNRLGAERENIEGTGIGLTIVRALVERMGGWVEVDSVVDEGSEFRIWLQPAPEASESTPAGESAAARPVEVALQDITVLYIEDNPVNVLLVQELVAMRKNVTLHIAVDGRSGIDRARELLPRAVLIDLQLPDIDGFEVLRVLREDSRLADSACIALSANAMPDDIARASALGFDDYWSKPIDFGQFLSGLDRLATA
jgi:signal transduction histidine kinase/ActR/RegA family two-component response regulator